MNLDVITEGFFKNFIKNVSEDDVEKIEKHYDVKFDKIGINWMVHIDGKHLFTYSVRNKTLMTDYDRVEILKVIGG